MAKKRVKAEIPENREKTGNAAKKNATSFKPGLCPNPGGRPKKTDEERTLEAMCREKTIWALGTILHLMRRGKTERVKLAAAEVVIDRGHGKAVDRVISENHTTIEHRRVQGADEILGRALAGGKNGSNRGVGKTGLVLPAAVHPEPTRH